jgi:uncharacterized protein YcbX
LPDGTTVTSVQKDLNQVLSKALNRDVTLAVTKHGHVTGVQSSAPTAFAGSAEEYWPHDVEGLDYHDAVTDFVLPTGTFFDTATVLILTTATLVHLGNLDPQGRFEVRRFRPNIVVEPETTEAEKSFVENAWVGHTLAIGDEVRLSITTPCTRCVRTTLPQGDLPKDSGILRTAVQQNHGNVGVYAAVAHGGMIRRGDRIRLVD